MSEQADNRAPYAQIAAHYAELITSGELVPGSLLPSIKNLAQEWKVSTATAEKALRKLRTEGLVRGIHGIGTEVLDRPSPMSSGSQRQDRGRRSGSSWGSGERSDSHQAAVVAGACGCGGGTGHRARFRGDQATPGVPRPARNRRALHVMDPRAVRTVDPAVDGERPLDRWDVATAHRAGHGPPDHSPDRHRVGTPPYA